YSSYCSNLSSLLLFQNHEGDRKGAPIGINLCHEDRQNAGRSVGAILMVARWGWVRDPVPCWERDERAARPTDGRPSRSPLRIVQLLKSLWREMADLVNSSFLQSQLHKGPTHPGGIFVSGTAPSYANIDR